MGLSRTISDINGDFSRKSQNFFQPRVFCAPAERFPVGIGYRRLGSKTKVMGLQGRERSLTIFSAVWIQYTTVTDRQTDRQMDVRTLVDSKDRAYA